MTSRESPSFLTLKNADTLLNQVKPRDQMLFFSIRNDLFPLHLNTYVMDLRQLGIFYSYSAGVDLDLRIWRLIRSPRSKCYLYYSVAFLIYLKLTRHLPASN